MGTEFWVAHVDAVKLETISAREYARRHGLSVAALYYWQRKLKSNAEAGEAGHASKFVALRVADAAAVRRSCLCTLVLPQGMHLEMSALPAPGWLADLGLAMRGAR
jgi:transposase-like protein